ncbi:MAG: hypothetical protein R3B93_29330, partial [Bacteroidia bacterium]
MAKFISICYKKPTLVPDNIEEILTNLSQRLVPEGISVKPARIISDETLYTAIISPNDIIKRKEASFCFGVMVGETSSWHQPGGTIPDGSYALLRVNKKKIEWVSDAAASRAIWYYFDENLFIASSSQRAIISLIGSYEPNKETYSWFFASGYHGPYMGWDKRITHVKPYHSRIVLNRLDWSLEKIDNEFSMEPDKTSDSSLEARFNQTYKDLFPSLQLDYSKWFLPLSGGTDSRLLLYLAKSEKDLQTITWGFPGAKENPFCDPMIAARVAQMVDIPNRFYDEKKSDLPFETILQRFLIAGEGRIDRIGGYIDGFELINQLTEDGVRGMIRGEYPVSDMDFSPNMDRVLAEIAHIRLTSNFTQEQLDSWELSPTDFPPGLQRHENETLTTYRERLTIGFRNTSRYSSLNDLKLLHQEIVQPFLFKSVIDINCNLPDHLRINKHLFRKLTSQLGPD